MGSRDSLSTGRNEAGFEFRVRGCEVFHHPRIETLEYAECIACSISLNSPKTLRGKSSTIQISPDSLKFFQKMSDRVLF